MAGASWTLEEQRELISLRSQRPPVTWAECARALGRSKDAVRSYYRWLKNKGILAEPSDDFEPPLIDEFDEQVCGLLSDGEDKDAIHWQKLIELADETQEALQELEPAKDIQKRRLPGEPYPIVLYSGDWHLGHKATDYARWLYEISMLLRSKNTYLIDLGDDRQNSRSARHLAWILSQVLPVELQAQVIVSVTKELVDKGKLLAKIGGTHDLHFDKGVAGQALLAWLYRQHESIAFFENKGLLKLIVEYEQGEKEFPNLLFHKARYSSFLSTLHSNRREYQLTFPGKVVAGAHDHVPGAEMYWHYGLLEKAGYPIGGWSWNIKVGSFTSSDDQFRDLGSFHHRTEVFCPACVYMPEGIVLLPTLRDALAFRAGIPAAKKHEEELIDGLELSDERKAALKNRLVRQFAV